MIFETAVSRDHWGKIQITKVLRSERKVLGVTSFFKKLGNQRGKER